MAKGTVPKRELTPAERSAAERLKAAWDEYRGKDHNKGATQAWLGKETGLGNQSLIGQYLGGTIPLNHKALFAICKVINADPAKISPELSSTLPTGKKDEAHDINRTALVYVDPDELRILTAYREATHRGQQFILDAVLSVDKK